jgi:hypothetical protein
MAKCSHAVILPNLPATSKKRHSKQSGRNQNFSFNFATLKGIKTIVESVNMSECAVDVGPELIP